MHSCTFVRKSFQVALSSALATFSIFAQAPAPAPAPAPQQPAPSQPTSPGAGTPGRTDPGQVPGRQQPFPQDPRQQQQDRFPDMQQQRMFFFSGKVMLDDGTPPPDPVVIERVCNGTARPEGYTDSKGRFSFQLGQNSAMMADASVNMNDPAFGGGGRGGMMGQGQGINERDLMGCELRAALAGFRSDVVSLAGRRSLDNPDVGTIVLHRMAKVEGFTFSGTTSFAPKDAKKAYEKGREANKKKKFPDAEKELTKAVTTYPKFAAAWYELGTVYHQQSKLEEARKAYGEAMKADEKFVSPYGPMARLAAGEKKWEEAAELSAKLIKLNPYYSPDAYFISSVANLNLNHLDQAEEHAREAANMDKQHRNPRINQVLAVILAQKQDYAGAAASMRDFLKFAPNAPEAPKMKEELAELEKRISGQQGGAAQAQ